ncbi:MAG: signal peptidase II [Candidatus Nanopelagicales bacterium]|nr:signal peptidase II [Candidatus Nanopelagicales bacterium]MDZ4248507.1 signal peptidase II [Candidatus Nanopelagicales bacterium]
MITPATKVTRRGLAWVLAVAVVVVGVDQFTKWLAIKHLEGHQPVEVLGDFLRLSFARNSGAAFSIGTGQTWIFTVIAVCVAIGILFAATRVTSVLWLVDLGLLLGGAAGNLVDRATQPPGFGIGHVVDFIQLPNWPVFNVADMSVVIAACGLVALTVFGVPAAPASSDPEPAQDGLGGVLTAPDGEAG